MTRTLAALTTALACLTGAAAAQSLLLLEQIEENRQTLTLKAPLTFRLPEAILLPDAQLWMHVQNRLQSQRAGRLAEVLGEGVEVGGVARQIEIWPTQVVDFGPNEGQVRYFKPEDRATAERIAEIAGDMGLELAPTSMVESFAGADYLEIGHLEIWFPKR